MFLLARRLLVLLALGLPASLVFGQAYTSILVFGDSLSDTGNVAHLTTAAGSPLPVPGPPLYTSGRFTDGTDTLPAATKYTGVWIEQLAETFSAKPTVTASLDGGTNYAYGYAFTGTGTSPLDLAPGLTVTVDNIGQQVTDYLTAHPAVPANTLVVFWGGANDVINATSTAQITTAVAGELSAIQRLISAGATDLLIANVPPLGAVPRFNTDPTLSADATAGSQAFNAGLAAGIAALPSANAGKTLNLKAFDVFSLFSSVIANPAANALVNVTSKSQAALVDPDTYLFWDDLHPTTTVHHLLAVAAAALVAPPSPSISIALSPASVTVASGATATSTLTVTPAGGFSGSVSITCGTLPADASCNTSSTPPKTFSTPQDFTITIATNGKTIATPASFTAFALSAPGALTGLLSCIGLALLIPLGRGARGIRPSLLMLLAALSLTLLGGLSGCGGSGHNTPAGTYTIPLTVTPSVGAATTVSLTLIVQ